MIKVKFTADKGYAKAGDVETYPDDEAKNLISEGVAELFKPEVTEEEKFTSKFNKKGITNV